MQYPMLTSSDWGVVRGCTKVSPGCKHCHIDEYVDDAWTKTTVMYEAIRNPPPWKKFETVTVAENGDLFHEGIPDSAISEVLGVIRAHPDVRFMVLTKRAERLDKLLAGEELPPNIRIGVSAENQVMADSRIPALAGIRAKRYVSAQPLLGPILLPDVPIDWIVVGQEWGETYRPMNEDWVRSLRDQCRERGILMSYQQKMVGADRVLFPKLDGVKIQQFIGIK